jgi:predicted dehydrogenase
LSSAQKLSSSLPSTQIPTLYSNDSPPGSQYQDILADPNIHGVIIALPIPNQPEYVEAALRAGKHVLSEKPIAHTLQEAERLVGVYEGEIKDKGVLWGVAENFRWLENWKYAAEQVRRLGKVTGFRVEVFGMVKVGDKYFGMSCSPYFGIGIRSQGRGIVSRRGIRTNERTETEWRKNPTHQGGFLLDGGVHFTAFTRLVLDSPVAELRAYSSQIQPHLPPVDTITSIWKTQSGAIGTWANSFGTHMKKGSVAVIGCENGTVTIDYDTVTVKEGENTTEKKLSVKTNGVIDEIQGWINSIEQGVLDARLNPRQAMADLELLEGMLVSGEKGGEKIVLRHQI